MRHACILRRIVCKCKQFSRHSQVAAVACLTPDGTQRRRVAGNNNRFNILLLSFRQGAGARGR